MIEHQTPTNYLPDEKQKKPKTPVISRQTQNKIPNSLLWLTRLYIFSHVFLSNFISCLPPTPALLSLFPQDTLDSLLFLELSKPPFQSFWEWLISSCVSCGSLPTSLKSSQIFISSQIPPPQECLPYHPFFHSFITF